MVAPHRGAHYRAMRPSGYTLVELIFVLAVLGILLGIALPPLAHWRDRAAVHAAREELAGALAWTRLAAASRGGATLVLDPAGPRFWVRAAGVDGPPVDLRQRYGVRIDGRPALRLFRYDLLGIGRITSATVRLRRGSAEAGLVVSAYGRVRRW